MVQPTLMLQLKMAVTKWLRKAVAQQRKLLAVKQLLILQVKTLQLSKTVVKSLFQQQMM